MVTTWSLIHQNTSPEAKPVNLNKQKEIKRSQGHRQRRWDEGVSIDRKRRASQRERGKKRQSKRERGKKRQANV